MGGQVKLGDPVWAKMKGFPWWPGKVIGLPGQQPEMRKARRNKQSYCIAFFGTNDYAWMKETDFRPYEKFKEKLTQGRKSALFRHSCNLLEEYLRSKKDDATAADGKMVIDNGNQVDPNAALDKGIPLKKTRGRPGKRVQEKPVGTKSKTPKARKSAAGEKKQTRRKPRGPGGPRSNRAPRKSAGAVIMRPPSPAGEQNGAGEIQGQTSGNYLGQEPGGIQIESSFSTRDPPSSVLSLSSGSQSFLPAESVLNSSWSGDLTKPISMNTLEQLDGHNGGTVWVSGVPEQRQLKQEYFQNAFRAISVLHEVCSQIPEIRVCLLPLSEITKTIARNHQKFIFPQGYSTVSAPPAWSSQGVKVDPEFRDVADDLCEVEIQPNITIDD